VFNVRFCANLCLQIGLGGFLYFAVAGAGSCQAPSPQTASQAITLMTRYGNEGRYDSALNVGRQWLKDHPDDVSHEGLLHRQMGTIFLMKASKDLDRREEWIREAVASFDRDLSVRSVKAIDIEPFNVGHGFESAGDLTKSDKCLYYEKAIKAFQQQIPMIEGDSRDAHGTTIQLAPIREENEKAMRRVQTKLLNAGCK
jgi:hypothetical protein